MARSTPPGVSLVMNPGTDAQRALWTMPVDSPAYRERALASVRKRFGEKLPPLAWLDQATMTLTKIKATKKKG